MEYHNEMFPPKPWLIADLRQSSAKELILMQEEGREGPLLNANRPLNSIASSKRLSCRSHDVKQMADR